MACSLRDSTVPNQGTFLGWVPTTGQLPGAWRHGSQEPVLGELCEDHRGLRSQPWRGAWGQEPRRHAFPNAACWSITALRGHTWPSNG